MDAEARKRLEKVLRKPYLTLRLNAYHASLTSCALAIHYEDLIRLGHVTDFAELARLGHVTRARVAQIMNLRLLAPDIQEQLSLLPRIVRGRAEVNLRDLQGIAVQVD